MKKYIHNAWTLVSVVCISLVSPILMAQEPSVSTNQPACISNCLDVGVDYLWLMGELKDKIPSGFNFQLGYNHHPFHIFSNSGNSNFSLLIPSTRTELNVLYLTKDQLSMQFYALGLGGIWKLPLNRLGMANAPGQFFTDVSILPGMLSVTNKTLKSNSLNTGFQASLGYEMLWQSVLLGGGVKYLNLLDKSFVMNAVSLSLRVSYQFSPSEKSPPPEPVPTPTPEPVVKEEPVVATPEPIVESKVKIANDKLEVNEKIFFEKGKAVVSTDSYNILDTIAQILIENPHLLLVQIEGHTDNSGKKETNIMLSQQRAEAVRAYIIQKGVDGSRLKAQGFGPEVPIADNQTPEGREKNRRVEFKVLKSSN